MAKGLTDLVKLRSNIAELQGKLGKQLSERRVDRRFLGDS